MEFENFEAVLKNYVKVRYCVTNVALRFRRANCDAKIVHKIKNCK